MARRIKIHIDEKTRNHLDNFGSSSFFACFYLILSLSVHRILASNESSIL